MTGSWHDRHIAGRTVALASLLAILFATGCGDGKPTAGSDPIPGELVIALAPDAGEIGAIQLTIVGREIGEVVSANVDHAMFVRRTSDAGVAVVIVGEALAGPLVRLRVPDVRAASSYRVSIDELADRENRLAESVDRNVVTIGQAD